MSYNQNRQMIDSHEIQQLLKDSKLNSMTDVIQFVIQNVYKMMSYDPIQQITLRLTELQKPKGLDHVMLEEVKTLIQAMFEQKQDKIRRDLQKTVHSSMQLALQHENTRKSLREIDMLQLLNSRNHNTKRSFSPLKKQNNEQNNFAIEIIKKQIAQIRSELQRKPDRRQLNQVNIKYQREVSSKMSIVQTEKIVQKFQKEVFQKLNQTSLCLQKMQYSLKKSLLDQAVQIKKQLWDSCKMKELKSVTSKLEKKMKKIQNQFVQLSTCMGEQSKQLKDEMKEYIQQVVVLIEGLNENQSERYRERQRYFEERQIKQQEISKTLQKFKQSSSGVWLAESHYNVNNMAISWSRQLLNKDSDQYHFETRKSKIMISQPGYYQISCNLSGCEKSPSLLINSQFYSRLQSKNSRQLFAFSQIVHLQKPKSLIQVRLETGNCYETAILKVTKIS